MHLPSDSDLEQVATQALTDPALLPVPVVLSPDDLRRWREWMQGALYVFSAKTVNSNASAIGVRPGAGATLALPYIGVLTLAHRGIHVGLDYTITTDKAATRFKDLRIHLGETVAGPAKSVPQKGDQQSKIKRAAKPLVLPVRNDALWGEYCAVRDTPGESGTHFVSSRLRQLLLPRPDGSYVAMTPLGSAGLAEQVQEALQHRKERRDAQGKSVPQEQKIYAETKVRAFSVGGSNPQNVGGRVRSMHRPVVCTNFPQASSQLRAALGMVHRGIRWSLPQANVQTYLQWWTRRLEGARAGSRPWTLRDTDKERALLSPLVESLRAQADHAYQILDEALFELPWVSEASDSDSLPTPISVLKLSALDIGWLSTHHRSPAWRKEAALAITKQLAAWRLGSTEEGQPIHADLNRHDQIRLRNALEGMLS